MLMLMRLRPPVLDRAEREVWAQPPAPPSCAWASSLAPLAHRAVVDSSLIATEFGPGEERFAARTDVVVGELPVAVDVDHCDEREDPADEVGTTRSGVFVGRTEQRTQRELDRLIGRQPFAPTGLDPVARVRAAG